MHRLSFNFPKRKTIEDEDKVMNITKMDVFFSVISKMVIKLTTVYFLLYAVVYLLFIKMKHIQAGHFILVFISFCYILILIYVYEKATAILKKIGSQEKLTGRNFKMDMRGCSLLSSKNSFCCSKYWFVCWEKLSFYAFCKESINNISPIMIKGKKFYVKVDTKDGKHHIILFEKKIDNLKQLLIWYENI